MCGGEKVEGGQGEEEVLETLGTLPERASMGHRYVLRCWRVSMTFESFADTRCCFGEVREDYS